MNSSTNCVSPLTSLETNSTEKQTNTGASLWLPNRIYRDLCVHLLLVSVQAGDLEDSSGCGSQRLARLRRRCGVCVSVSTEEGGSDFDRGRNRHPEHRHRFHDHPSRTGAAVQRLRDDDTGRQFDGHRCAINAAVYLLPLLSIRQEGQADRQSGEHTDHRSEQELC